MPSIIGLLPNIGPLELGIVLVIVIIVLGPKRIPQAARSVGEGFRNFKGSVKGPDEDKPDELTENRADDPVSSKAPGKNKTES